MKLDFTRHALRRMVERAVSEDEIYEVFENQSLVLEKENAVIIGHTNRRRYLTLVIDRGSNRLLALWPSSRAQRNIYRRRIGIGGKNHEEKKNA